MKTCNCPDTFLFFPEPRLPCGKCGLKIPSYKIVGTLPYTLVGMWNWLKKVTLRNSNEIQEGKVVKGGVNEPPTTPRPPPPEGQD